jgi:hypothetical protein
MNQKDNYSDNQQPSFTNNGLGATAQTQRTLNLSAAAGNKQT